jgi:hypothetical protein
MCFYMWGARLRKMDRQYLQTSNMLSILLLFISKMFQEYLWARVADGMSASTT